MLELELDGHVLGNTTFALSPLAEVTASLWRYRDDVAQPALDRRWRSDARQNMPAEELALLEHVVPPVSAVAEFMIPSTIGPSPSIEDQLHVLAATPTQTIEREFRELWPGPRLPTPLRQLLDHENGAGHVLADAVHRYWTRVMAPHWPRILAVLEDDVAHHLTVARHEGLTALITGLHPCLRVQEDVLRLQEPQGDTIRPTRLRLVPSAFLWSKVLTNYGQPEVVEVTYGAYGAGRLWNSARPDRRNALDALLGRSRASILIELAVPASTTQLASRLGHSMATTSWHLSVLTQGSLIARSRAGRVVWYQQTPLGTSLVEITSQH